MLQGGREADREWGGRGESVCVSARGRWCVRATKGRGREGGREAREGARSRAKYAAHAKKGQKDSPRDAGSKGEKMGERGEKACLHPRECDTHVCVCVCVCARAGKREYLQAVKRRIDLNPKP